MFDLVTQEALLAKAYKYAFSSPDPSTQNGAILVDRYGSERSSGINTFPIGVRFQPERLDRPVKYSFIEHAERNAIYNAAFYGESTAGLIMVCPWAACADCARGIINAGISTLITHQESFERSSDHWKKSIDIAFKMFEEAGVGIIWYEGTNILNGNKILRDGQFWCP